MWLLNKREGSVTASWLQTWNVTGPVANPPHGSRIPNKIAYIKHYAIDMTYVTPPGKDETPETFK
jgi:hypothetical protein